MRKRRRYSGPFQTKYGSRVYRSYAEFVREKVDAILAGGSAFTTAVIAEIVSELDPNEGLRRDLILPDINVAGARKFVFLNGPADTTIFRSASNEIHQVVYDLLTKRIPRSKLDEIKKILAAPTRSKPVHDNVFHLAEIRKSKKLG